MDVDAVFWAVVLIFAVPVLVAFILFLLNLRSLLRQVSPQNRMMQPDYVWLNLVPLFGYAWMIITVMRVRDSVTAEFKSRGWYQQGDLGFGVGLAFAILSIVGGAFTFVPWLVCWIIYWVKTSGLAKQLAQSQPPAGWAPSSTLPGYDGSATSGTYPDVYADAYSGTQALVTPSPSQSCSSCGAIAQPGDQYCRSCGERLGLQALSDPTEVPTTEQPSCPYCGARNRLGAQFCSSCGRKMP